MLTREVKRRKNIIAIWQITLIKWSSNGRYLWRSLPRVREWIFNTNPRLLFLQPSVRPKTFKNNDKRTHQGSSSYRASQGPLPKENHRGNYASRPLNRNFQQPRQRDYRDDPRGAFQRSWEYRRDPRDHPSTSRVYTPRRREIPLFNRFTPISHNQDGFDEDGHVIVRHPNQYDDYSNHGRNDYQNSPRDFLGESQTHHHFFPRSNNRGKRGYQEREALEAGGGSGPKKRKQ